MAISNSDLRQQQDGTFSLIIQQKCPLLINCGGQGHTVPHWLGLGPVLLEPGRGVCPTRSQEFFSLVSAGSIPQAVQKPTTIQTLLVAVGCPLPVSYLQVEAVQATPVCRGSCLQRLVEHMLLLPTGS